MIGPKVLPNLIANDVAAAYEHAVAKGCSPVAPPTENHGVRRSLICAIQTVASLKSPHLLRPKTEMDQTTKAAIAEHILEMIAQLAPKVTYRSMYGGTVIDMRPSEPKSRVAGVFIYANTCLLILKKVYFWTIQTNY